MSILSVEHLTKIYGEGDTAVRALDDVSFTVEAGEFIAIVGSSGSGKSTLLHIIGGVDRPTSGSVYVQGQSTDAPTSNSLSFVVGKSALSTSSTTSSPFSTLSKI